MYNVHTLQSQWPHLGCLLASIGCICFFRDMFGIYAENQIILVVCRVKNWSNLSLKKKKYHQKKCLLSKQKCWIFGLKTIWNRKTQNACPPCNPLKRFLLLLIQKKNYLASYYKQISLWQKYLIKISFIFQVILI